MPYYIVLTNQTSRADKEWKAVHSDKAATVESLGVLAISGEFESQSEAKDIADGWNLEMLGLMPETVPLTLEQEKQDANLSAWRKENPVRERATWNQSTEHIRELYH